MGTEDLEVAMKRVVISSVAVIAMLAAAATIFGSHTSPTRRSGAASTISLDDLQAKADKNRLPALEIEDRSLIFSTPAQP